MSKFSEYIGLIPKALKNPTKVLEGVVNSVKMEFGALPKDEQQEIIRRRLICESCPFMSRNAKTSQEYFDAYGDHYQSDRKEDHCSCCQCLIGYKTSSLSSDCGATVYNYDHPNKIPVRWTKYK
jgi:hypothetical protein